MTKIIVCKAATHNLKEISCSIPHGSMCCITGVSGSGKSSFAFDTLFVEGQRRYIQSLSHHAKRIIGSLPPPDVESISGLTPTIAIEQKTSSGSPRSTVGTLTEIYDYLRILYAKAATAYCPLSGEKLVSQTKADIIRTMFKKFFSKKMTLLAPWGKELKGSLKEHFEKIEKEGFSKIFLDGVMGSLSSLPHIDPSAAHTLDVVIDRVEITESHKERLEESVATALDIGSGVCYLLDPETDEKELFSESAYSQISGQFYPKLEPHDFSFNTPAGMCEECQGLGITQEFVLEKIIDPKKSLSQDFCSVATSYTTNRYRNIYDNLAHIYDFSVDTPWEKLSSQAQHVLLYGTEKKWTRMIFVHPKTGATWTDIVRWQGILHEAKIKYQEAKSQQYKQKIETLLVTGTCPLCHGSRLKAYPSAAKFHNLSIQEFTSQPIDDTLLFFSRLSLDQPYLQDIIFQIHTKLSFLHQVGAGYLSLDRGTLTLSGGEFQRVKLASHLGSSLTGVTYVLDEPSIGLHPHDTHKLIHALSTLRETGNTVVVVEHDPSIIKASDWILDFGPGAGLEGGSLLFEGKFSDFKKAKNSLTSSYLYGKKKIERKTLQKKPDGFWLTLQGASLHNLKKDTLSLPLGLFVAITGVSGSGKSSLLLDTLYPALSNALMRTHYRSGPYTKLSGVEHLDKVIHIDQTPIGRTPRSNPATYTGVFDHIRALFASLPESKAKGWTPGRFSFNVKEGSCPVCTGMGMIQVQVDFLEDTWVECSECHGKRFDTETLSVSYKEKSIHDVLSMTCKEACLHFSAIPQIKKGLEILCRVGLGYLQLGQSSTTLSGGEAQRLKIAKELARPATGRTLYILDEPTTGLHFHDLTFLLDVLHELVEKKNTVVVIEHNMDLVKTADWVIDLGPSSGEGGGHIIACGTPEEVSLLNTPTGKALQSEKKKPSAPQGAPPQEPTITIQGARQHNLKNLNLSLPKNAIIALIGPSGSGKASLAFDTLFAEGQRKYVESLSPYARQFIKQMSKPLFDSIQGLVPAVAIEQRRHAWNPRSTIGTMTEIYDYLRIIFSCHGTAHCPKTGSPIKTISKERVADILLALEPKRTFLFAPLPPHKSSALPLQIDALKKLGYTRLRIDGKMIDTEIEKFPEIPAGRLVPLDILVDRLTPSLDERARLVQSIGEACRLSKDRLLTLRGNEERLFNLAFAVEETGESFPEITPLTFSFSSPQGMCTACEGTGKDEIFETACLSCKGTRLNPLARGVTIDATSLPELCSLPLSKILSWLVRIKESLHLEKSILHAFQECIERASLAEEIGIGYLSLDRGAETLSMGEAERVHFLSQIGSRLSELLYVIDEPTVGLHPDDVTRLNKVLQRLKALGNTLVVIEHDKQFIRHADHIIELGKGSGAEGGDILFEGDFKNFKKSRTSVTAPYFHKKLLTFPKNSFSSKISFTSVSCHNLKNISCSLPLNTIVGIAGVSGSGKSTLMFDVIEQSVLAHLAGKKQPFISSGLHQINRIVSFDQKPHGTTSRSDLLTFLDLSDSLRDFFSRLPQAKELGLVPSHFSTSHRNGRCPKCFGLGRKKIDMYFLPPVEVPCDLCHGLRFKDTTLSIKYCGYNMGELLSLPISKVRPLFVKPSKFTLSLDALLELGMPYLSLGQEMATLSFGEAQRVSFARELAHKRKRTTLYLFDEPTNGLHAQELESLVKKLYHLRDEGHSLLLIEHNLDVIASCDFIIELGPEGGERGGFIVAAGTPDSLKRNNHSRIGHLLKSKDHS